MVLIFTTVNTITTAKKIGEMLLKSRLIVCYNLFPVKSAYWWKGKIEKGGEVLMILKTKEANFEKVEAFIRKHSGYEIPEIIAMKPTKVSKTYLNWLNAETK